MIPIFANIIYVVYFGCSLLDGMKKNYQILIGERTLVGDSTSFIRNNFISNILKIIRRWYASLYWQSVRVLLPIISKVAFAACQIFQTICPDSVPK